MLLLFFYCRFYNLYVEIKRRLVPIIIAVENRNISYRQIAFDSIEEKFVRQNAIRYSMAIKIRKRYVNAKRHSSRPQQAIINIIDTPQSENSEQLFFYYIISLTR